MTEASGASRVVKTKNGAGWLSPTQAVGVVVGLLIIGGTVVWPFVEMRHHEMRPAHSGAEIRLQSIEKHLVVDAERRFSVIEGDVKEIKGDMKILLRRVPE